MVKIRSSMALQVSVFVFYWSLCYSSKDKTMINIALNKTYRISSKYLNEGQFSVSDAANGNTSPYFPANCIHTAVGDSSGWWEVDLGTSYAVYSITVWGRDGGMRRLYPFTITVDGQQCASMQSGSLVQSLKCSSIITGRQVRLQRNGSDCCLNLCEFQIYVCSPGWYGDNCHMRCKSTRCHTCDQVTGLCIQCLGQLVGDYCTLENIALGKMYSMSSMDHAQISVSDAANGNTSTYWPGNCIHTWDGDPTGWWEVDLGTSYPVYSIRVWGRTRWVERLYPFSITVDGQQCARMENGNLVQTVTCSSVITGRRVRFHRIGGNCCLNLCELQIYVCRDGYYGVNCTQTCNPAGCLRCHRLSGQCCACHDFYSLVPSSCTDCQVGWYGNHCLQRCGHCQDGGPCNKTQGHCPACEPGWYPPLCITACRDGTYGTNCSRKCGSCRDAAICSKSDGRCPGCTAGKQPPLCVEVCTPGNYGPDCGQICGHCQDEYDCDSVTGHCLSGCEPGYVGQNCQQECPDGWYGDNCTSQCGHCLNNITCIKSNGSCPCTLGKQPPLCKSACQNYTYGQDCTQHCGKCYDDLPCDPFNGDCHAGCQPGNTSRQCQTVLPPLSHEGLTMVAVVTGSTVSTFVILVVTLGLICRWLRRRHYRLSEVPRDDNTHHGTEAAGTNMPEQLDHIDAENEWIQDRNEVNEHCSSGQPRDSIIYEPVHIYCNVDNDQHMYAV